MRRFAKNAWRAFGRIFDFAPERTKAGQKITEMRITLSRRGELSAIGADVQKVLGDTKSRNEDQWLIQKTTRPKEDVDIAGGTMLDARIFISVEKVSPGSGTELLNMAKKEQEHRHSLENQLISANIEDMRKEYASITRGQWFAFLTTLCALGLSTFLIMNDYSIEGSVLGGSALALVVASFIRGGKRHNP